MQASLFDGTQVASCSVEQATRSVSSTGVTWVDLALSAPHDPSAVEMLKALGLDPADVAERLSAGLSTDFRLAPDGVHGVAWMDDCDGSPSTQTLFSWTQQRLVTVRLGGDAAIAHVRTRITERMSVLSEQPSTVLGVVLQLMLGTVRTGLTQLAVGVGELDMEIIQASSPEPDQAQRLNGLRQSFAPLAMRFPVYQAEVGEALIDPGVVAGLDPAGIEQLRQFQAGVATTAALIDSLAAGMRDAAQDFQAQVSGWQGQRINVLTVVTMIFLPITFLTGYFGMNFDWLDDQLESAWSWILLGVLVPLALVVVSIALLNTNGYRVPRLRRSKNARR